MVDFEKINNPKLYTFLYVHLFFNRQHYRYRASQAKDWPSLMTSPSSKKEETGGERGENYKSAVTQLLGNHQEIFQQIFQV